MTDTPTPEIRVTTRFSASRLKTWSACPLQGHYTYDLLLPGQQGSKATYGSCLHAALHAYHEGASPDAAQRMFQDLWANPEKIGLAIDYWNNRTSYSGLLARGLSVIDRYHQSRKWDEREVLACEHPFLVPFGDFELTGYVDLLELRKSGNGQLLLAVVDLKGGSYQPKTAELRLDLQFTVYMRAVNCREFWVGDGTPEFPGIPDGEALFEELKDVPRRAIWCHLDGPKDIDAGPRDDTDYKRMHRLMVEVNRAERAQVFVPRIGDACQWCDYQAECGIDLGPIKDEEAWI